MKIETIATINLFEPNLLLITRVHGFVSLDWNDILVPE